MQIVPPFLSFIKLYIYSALIIGMSNGTSLDHQHQQGDDSRDTYPKKDKQPAGLKKISDEERVKHAKVGSEVAYTKGHGVIVSKEGSYVTIFNETANAYDQVHAGETYIPGDSISMGIMNQLWDQMQMETRIASLHKANVRDVQHFVDRKWSELPISLKDVLKLMPGSASNKPMSQTMTPQGRNTLIGTTGTKLNTGRTVGEKKKPTESKGPERKRKPAGEGSGSFAAAAAARSTGAPGQKKEEPKDEGVTFATGLDKATNYGELATEIYKMRNELNKIAQLKSDVEHGAYGGVVTDTPFDADNDYEEDKREGDLAQGTNPKDPKSRSEEVMIGFHKKEGEGGAVTTGTPGTNNPLSSNKPSWRITDEPEETKKSIVNKYNTRYGTRQASQEEVDEYLNK